jgi:hypothetical protein
MLFRVNVILHLVFNYLEYVGMSMSSGVGWRYKILATSSSNFFLPHWNGAVVGGHELAIRYQPFLSLSPRTVCEMD